MEHQLPVQLDMRQQIQEAELRVVEAATVLKAGIEGTVAGALVGGGDHRTREWAGRVDKSIFNYVEACLNLAEVLNSKDAEFDEELLFIVGDANAGDIRERIYQLANDYADSVGPAFDNFTQAGDIFTAELESAAEEFQRSSQVELKFEAQMAVGLGLTSAATWVLAMFVSDPTQVDAEGNSRNPADVSLGLSVITGLAALAAARAAVNRAIAMLEAWRLSSENTDSAWTLEQEDY
ncbi:MAG: hypothetical protein H0T78_05515 [Longispora sp.]|nr:hypothetical protein [Longispora sp. (in: high G+C Gram-positive bacteria)]